jgi:hypothetical protein
MTRARARTRAWSLGVRFVILYRLGGVPGMTGTEFQDREVLRPVIRVEDRGSPPPVSRNRPRSGRSLAEALKPVGQARRSSCLPDLHVDVVLVGGFEG